MLFGCLAAQRKHRPPARHRLLSQTQMLEQRLSCPSRSAGSKAGVPRGHRTSTLAEVPMPSAGHPDRGSRVDPIHPRPCGTKGRRKRANHQSQGVGAGQISGSSEPRPRRRRAHFFTGFGIGVHRADVGIDLRRHPEDRRERICTVCNSPVLARWPRSLTGSA